MPTPCARGHKRAATQTATDQMVGNGMGAGRSVADRPGSSLESGLDLPIAPMQFLLQQGEEVETGPLEQGDAGLGLAQADFVAGQ